MRHKIDLPLGAKRRRGPTHIRNRSLNISGERLCRISELGNRADLLVCVSIPKAVQWCGQRVAVIVTNFSNTAIHCIVCRRITPLPENADASLLGTVTAGILACIRPVAVCKWGKCGEVTAQMTCSESLPCFFPSLIREPHSLMRTRDNWKWIKVD